MRIAHLRTSTDGKSEFSYIEVPLKRDGVEQLAYLKAPEGLILNETDKGHNYPWHNAPKRQWVVTLKGRIRVRLRNGESQTFGPGSLLLADDLSGSGHATSVEGEEPWQCLYLPFSGEPIL